MSTRPGRHRLGRGPVGPVPRRRRSSAARRRTSRGTSGRPAAGRGWSRASATTTTGARAIARLGERRRHVARPDRSRARDRRGRGRGRRAGEPRYRLVPGRAWERIACTRRRASRRSARPACSSTARSRSARAAGLAGWRAAIAAAHARCLKVCDVNLRTERDRATSARGARGDRAPPTSSRSTTASSRCSATGSAGAIRSPSCASGRASSRSPTAPTARRCTANGGAIEIAGVRARPGGDNVGCGDAYLAILVHGMTLGWDLATCGRAASRWAAAVAEVRGATPRVLRRADRGLAGAAMSDERARSAEAEAPEAPASPRRRRSAPASRGAADGSARRVGPRGRVARRARRAARARCDHDRGADRPLARVPRRDRRRRPDVPLRRERAPRGLPARTATSTSGTRARTPATRRPTTTRSSRSSRRRSRRALFGAPPVLVPAQRRSCRSCSRRRRRIAACACMGATPWQAALAAFAVAFMNGESRWGAGNAGTFQVGLYTQTWALCAFPLALGHGARWICEAKGLAPAIAWGAFAACATRSRASRSGSRSSWRSSCGSSRRGDCGCSPTMLGVIVIYLAGCAVAAVAMLAIPNAPRPVDALADRRRIGAVLVALGAADRWKFLRPTRVASRGRAQLAGELRRLAILGGALRDRTAPVLLPLTVDNDGFGGFPHRVADEVGPGFDGLGKWYLNGTILDFVPPNMGIAAPGAHVRAADHPRVHDLSARGRLMRWLWAPALLFALLLGLGPHIGKIGDDLFPPVRALGAMQTVLALGIGAGAVMLGQWLWELAGTLVAAAGRSAKPYRRSRRTYAARTRSRRPPRSLSCSSRSRRPSARARASACSARHRAATATSSSRSATSSAKQPPGRKQVGPGAENHWWNLLSYVYDRVPSLLQMGGGGLQASPNYDFLWTAARLREERVALRRAVPRVRTRDRRDTHAASATTDRAHRRTTRSAPLPVARPGVARSQVIGVLPPGYRTGEPGHTAALEWLKRRCRSHDQMLAYVGSGRAGRRAAGQHARVVAPGLARRRRRHRRRGRRNGADDVRGPRELAPALARVRRRQRGARAPRDAGLPGGRCARRQAHDRAAVRATAVGDVDLAGVARCRHGRLAVDPPSPGRGLTTGVSCCGHVAASC